VKLKSTKIYFAVLFKSFLMLCHVTLHKNGAISLDHSKDALGVCCNQCCSYWGTHETLCTKLTHCQW